MAAAKESTAIDQLLGGERDVFLPCTLALHDAPMLQLLASLRLLPGKRLSARALWNDTPVMAKLFVRTQHGDAHAQAEHDGYHKVLAAQINTPRLLWQGESECRRLRVVLYEFLQPAHSFGAAIAGATDAQRQRLVDEMLALTTALHRVGAVQTDPHLDNFLWYQNDAWLVDVGSVIDKAPLNHAARLQNLALLLAQLPLAWHADVMSWCAKYNALLPVDDAVAPAQLLPAVAQRWRARGEDVLRKAQRECTATHVERSWWRFVACRRVYWNDALRALLDDPDEAMLRGKVLKDGNSATVVLVECDGRQLVIKRYNVKSVWHFLRRCWRKSRAWQSWRNAHLLEFVGIGTPAPVAMLERRVGPLRRVAYFVSEYLPAQEMRDIYATRAPTTAELEQTGEIFTLMQRARISHGDLKAQNLLIGSDNIVRLIDLDAMQWHVDDAGWRERFARDRQRFLRNWQGELLERFVALIGEAVHE